MVMISKGMSHVHEIDVRFRSFLKMRLDESDPAGGGILNMPGESECISQASENFETKRIR